MPTAQRYNRVSTNENEADISDANTTASSSSSKYSARQRMKDRKDWEKNKSEHVKWVSNKLHALFWVILGGCTLYFTDFIRVILEDKRVSRYVRVVFTHNALNLHIYFSPLTCSYINMHILFSVIFLSSTGSFLGVVDRHENSSHGKCRPLMLVAVCGSTCP